MVKRGQRNVKAHCNLMVPIITLGQKEVNLVYNVKREQEGGLIKILVPKRKKRKDDKEVSIIFSGEGSGNPLQYSCLEDSMDRGAWRTTVHGIAELDTTV